MWWFATCDVMWCDVISCCPVLLSNTKYYSVLHSTTPVLLCTTKYYSVQQSTTPVLLCTTPVLQSTTRVLLRTTKYYASTTPYYKVLESTTPVLQSTTPVLQSTTPVLLPVLLWTTPVLQSTSRVLLRTTKYYASTTPYYSSTTKYYSSTTRYYASTTLYYKVLIQYDKVLIQYYKVLQSITPVLRSTTPVLLCTTPYYKVLRQYYSVLQSTTPVLLCTTKYYSSTTPYYKVPLQYYKVLRQYYKVLLQVVSRPQKVTLELHQILRLSSKMTHILSPHHIWNVIYNARSNRCHHPTSPNTAPATQNDSHAWSSSHLKRHLQCAEQQVSPSNLTNYCACHTEWLACLIVVTSETSFTVRGATGVTIQPHQILHLPRKMTRLLYRPHIWNVISNARSNKCHYPTSPNTAPATKNDTARFQRKSPKTGETSFPMRGRSDHDPTMIRAWSEHDPTIIRPWNRQSATRLATEVTFRTHHEHFLLKNTTFRAQSYIQTFTKCCTCHQKCHLNFTKYCACHEKWHLNFTK